jgi:DNA-binding NtrC family response regulator
VASGYSYCLVPVFHGLSHCFQRALLINYDDLKRKPMPAREATILIIDDDQLHLTLYTWILQAEGYKCESALVQSTSMDLPSDAGIDLVLLDYRLSSSLSPLNVIEQLKRKFPAAPIVILSEVQWMPDDVRDHAQAFINKGDPKRLVETIHGILRGKT